VLEKTRKTIKNHKSYTCEIAHKKQMLISYVARRLQKLLYKEEVREHQQKSRMI